MTARAARQGQARPALLSERTPIKHRTGENQAEGRYFRAWPFAHPSAHLLIDRPVGPSVKGGGGGGREGGGGGGGGGSGRRMFLTAVFGFDWF